MLSSQCRRKAVIAKTKRQSGFALVFALLILLLLSVIGMASVRGTAQSEKIAANFRWEQQSQQSAEAAIASAENFLSTLATLVDDNGNYTLTSQRLPAGDRTQRTYWTSTGGFAWNATTATAVSVNVDGVEVTAYYVIEQIPVPVSSATGAPVEAFRVTARGSGGDSGVITILQTVYVR